MKQIKIAILGSTGSIGLSALKVVDRYPKRFKVIALSAYNNIKRLEEQIHRYRPRYVAVETAGMALIKASYGRSVKVLDVRSDLDTICSLKDVDVIIIGMRGSAALSPFLTAVRHGKTVAPANKEALVIAGDLIMKEARRCGATVIPVDSEQSAIFQCLQGHNHSEVKCIHLTASGGALRSVARKDFDRLSVREILNHPRWKMGDKITVDSASLMNKGFEVIEAQRLFDLRADQIRVVVHPEAIIHSMVEFVDGSVIAQMGITDMQLPIQYALTHPHRLPTDLPDMDFVKLGQLTFEAPDLKKFPSLALALDVAREEGTLPAVLNAADEVAVEAFLREKIKFTRIYDIVERVVRLHRNQKKPTLNHILKADQWAREQAEALL
jgi:1-deoxy-D-xylulose-5-phosphate reductoisomerase